MENKPQTNGGQVNPADALGLPTATNPINTPEAHTLDWFHLPIGDDENELIKHRFLCKKGGMMLVGSTGLGKSSLAMQLMIKWALGQSIFGLEPAHNLKSLLIQAENDDGDLAEMKDGVFRGLNLSDDDKNSASQSVLVYQECGRTGKDLCKDIIVPLLEEHKPDLLWLDPALAYIGGDMNSQEAVGAFLRNNLAPLIAKHNCGVIILHHTNKTSKDPAKQMTDPTYMGAGSAEWVNWMRGALVLNKTNATNIYELIAAKRGARLGWKEADGETTCYKKYIGHSKSPGTICWIEADDKAIEEANANSGKTMADVLMRVPDPLAVGKEELQETCKNNKIGRDLFLKLVKDLVKSKLLFEVKVPREGKVPKVLLSRKQIAVPIGITVDKLKRDSHGHYIIPDALSKPTKQATPKPIPDASEPTEPKAA